MAADQVNEGGEDVLRAGDWHVQRPRGRGSLQQQRHRRHGSHSLSQHRLLFAAQ